MLLSNHLYCKHRFLSMLANLKSCQKHYLSQSPNLTRHLYGIYMYKYTLLKPQQLSEDELEAINGLTYNEAEAYSDRPSNSSAGSSRTSSDHHHSHGEPGHSYSHPQIQSVLLTSSNSTKPSNDTSPRPDKPTFKCTYPGCAAVSFYSVICTHKSNYLFV